MVDITPFIPQGRQLINSYGGGSFTINNTRIEGSVLILPDRTVSWNVATPAELTQEAFASVVAEQGIEILLIGTGEKMAIVAPDVRAYIRNYKIAFEYMDTGAACRTYNVLLAEERRVAAALIAV